MQQKQATQLTLLFHGPQKCVFSLSLRLLIIDNVHCHVTETLWHNVPHVLDDQENIVMNGKSAMLRPI